MMVGGNIRHQTRVLTTATVLETGKGNFAMAIALGFILLLLAWGAPIHAAIVLGSLVAQGAAMTVLMKDPKAKAPWYNGTGVMAYVLGMMVSAVALGGLGTAP